MTRRKNQDFSYFGERIKFYRRSLDLTNNSRENFLNDRVLLGMIDENDISIKTLSNIENGYTLPNMLTLLTLSSALEVDIHDLTDDLLKDIQSNRQ